jgi:hypothetical protein
MRSRSGRVFVGIAAVVIGAVLSGCFPIPNGGPPQGGGGTSVERTIDGVVPPNEGRYEPVDCRSVGYVQRGANQTVPKLKLVLESPLWAFPIARETEPNAFLSRNVTTMTIALGAAEFFADQSREYHITYWCTSDKDQAWTVVG